MNLLISRLYKKIIETPLGAMVAVADEDALYMLYFQDGKNCMSKMQKLENIFGSAIISGSTKIHAFLEEELKKYFSGSLKEFSTPIKWIGTAFQINVWSQVQKIPAGATGSYLQLAQTIGNQKSVRAVANAQAKNHILLLIPCHRIIKSNGDICGYNGGVTRKKWLLEHEKLRL